MKSVKKQFKDRLGESNFEVLFNWSVGSVFGVLLLVWLVFELQLIPDSLLAVLIPVWIPSYVAFLIADGVRTIIPSLASGLVFGTVIILVTYFESVLLGNLFRIGRERLSA